LPKEPVSHPKEAEKKLDARKRMGTGQLAGGQNPESQKVLPQ